MRSLLKLLQLIYTPQLLISRLWNSSILSLLFLFFNMLPLVIFYLLKQQQKPKWKHESWMTRWCYSSELLLISFSSLFFSPNSFFRFPVAQLLARSKCQWLIQLVNVLTWLRSAHDEAPLSHWVVAVIKKLARCTRASVRLISKVWKRHSESAKHPVVFTRRR